MDEWVGGWGGVNGPSVVLERQLRFITYSLKSSTASPYFAQSIPYVYKEYRFQTNRGAGILNDSPV